MKKMLALFLALLMVCCVFAGCASGGEAPAAEGVEDSGSEAPAADGEESKDTFKIGFSAITLNGDFFTTMASELQQACYDQGLVASPEDVLVLNANSNTADEITNMDTFIAQGYDMIFVDSTNPDDIVPLIDQAKASGAEVICIDSYVNGGDKVTVVYSDNKQNGRKVGLAFAEEMGDQEIYSIMLSGVKGNVAGEERRVGIMCGVLEARLGITEEEAWELAYQMNDELINNGYTENTEAKFVIAGQGWGNWSIQDIMSDANDLIVKTHGKLNTIFSENDQMLYGGMQAAADAGLTEGIYYAAAADGEKQTCDYIKEGKVVAVGENSPVQIAKLAAQIAHEVLVEGKDPTSYPDTVTTDAVAITKENVDEEYDNCF